MSKFKTMQFKDVSGIYLRILIFGFKFVSSAAAARISCFELYAHYRKRLPLDIQHRDWDGVGGGEAFI